MRGASVAPSFGKQRSRTAAPGLAIAARRVGTAAVRMLVATALAVSVISLLVRPEAPMPAGWATVSVTPRTTLWDLAVAHPVEGLGTAGTVDLIRTENALTSSTLREGQTLQVPSSTPADSAVAQR